MLDGFFLSFLLDEIKDQILNLYIDKVYHTSKEELIIYFRSKQNYKLLLNINSSYSRLVLTDQIIENPATPTMFCMLMRKYLVNAKLTQISQYELERVVFLDFETSNEIGDKINVRLVLEIMGRHSNIILLANDGSVIDSIKRVGSNISRQRQILPKIDYSLPPNFNKLNLQKIDLKATIDQMDFDENSGELERQLITTFQGVSPIVAREIVFLTKQKTKSGASFKEGLVEAIDGFKNIIDKGLGRPVAFKTQDGVLKGFSFFKATHLEGLDISEEVSFSGLLEMFFREKNNIDRITQNSKDMINILNSIYKKLQNKLELQKKEKLECADKERYQNLAILLQSNLYRVKNNDRFIMVTNFFDNDKLLKIDLDPTISAAANAQRYFNKYKKMCVADKMLDDLIEGTQNEIIYIESVIDNILRSTTRENLEAIKLELQEEGYLSKKRNLKNKQKSKKDIFLKVKSVDGFDILIGNNNINNDRLTFKYASKNDLWFHAQKIPGAHVVVLSGGRQVPETTLNQAAKLAAKNSKAKDDNLVSVDFTSIKNVKKFKGARPGMVIYDDFKTIIVR